MSMYRQLWLAIITSTLLALLGSLLASTLSARSYLSEQLSMKNADNAAALALSLSQKAPDAVEVELVVSALFDSGHYELIRVTDPFGKVMVERRAAPNNNGVPGWFSRALPIVAESGQAQISSGWKQIGTIELVSHSRFAYRALWSSVLEMIGALAVAGLIGGYLGSLVLSRLRKPLTSVIDQAKAITERRFVTIDEPRVPELHQLAAAMNGAVVRLKTMFDDEAARLEMVRREVNCDPLTGLANRNNFLAQLRADLADEQRSGQPLAIAFVDLDGLKEVNDNHGHDAGDLVLCETARRLLSTVRGADFVARLGGDEFVIVYEPNDPNSNDLTQRIDRALSAPIEITSTIAVLCPASIGIADTRTTGYHSTELLAAADEAMYEMKRAHHATQ